MARALRRGPERCRLKLNKQFVVTHQDRHIFSVDSSTVRCLARPDEEFTNFATRDEFPYLIPRGEIWLGEKNLDKEGVFFIVNALVRLKEKEKGVSEVRAYTVALKQERALRKELTGLPFRDGKPHRRVPRVVYEKLYLSLSDPKFAVEVWLVDGNVVRSLYNTDYTEGGHGFVYPWVPKSQIWVEKDLDRWELPFIVSHEYIELRLMRDLGLGHDRAHAICSKVEFNLRQGKGAQRFLVQGRRRLSKRDLPKLTRENLLNYVARTYAHE
jgi:hypothetical protein